jgi:ribosomal protein S17
VFFAHDESEDCIEGDVVMIKSCQPISTKKHFVIDEVLERAPRYNPEQPELQ